MTEAQLEFKRRCDEEARNRKEALEAAALEFLEEQRKIHPNLEEPDQAFLLGYWLGRQRAGEEYREMRHPGDFVEEDFT